jgi:hypothetical protein
MTNDDLRRIAIQLLIARNNLDQVAADLEEAISPTPDSYPFIRAVAFSVQSCSNVLKGMLLRLQNEPPTPSGQG